MSETTATIVRWCREQGDLYEEHGGRIVKTIIPGIKAFHLFITDSCRKRNGEEIDEVIAGVNKAIDDLYRAWPEGMEVKIHVAVSVEYMALVEADPDDPEHKG